ncbi:hypothetical protein M0K88_004891 [Escherichia coli]|nr:hypothetical protein [Escherichia coli]
MRKIMSILEWFRPAPTMISSFAKDRALAVLARHRYQAHYYTPHSSNDDSELLSALRLLGRSGFLITDEHGNLVGTVEVATSGSESRARQQRAKFKVVE